MKRTSALLLAILTLALLLLVLPLPRVKSANEYLLIPRLQWKTTPIATDSLDFNLTLPPRYLNVSYNMATDFAFNDTNYGLPLDFNGTLYAFRQTFDAKYIGSASTRNDAYMNKDELGVTNIAGLRITSYSANGGCYFDNILWNAPTGASTSSLPLGTWASVSQVVVVNLNETNPPNYKTAWANVSIWDYNQIDVAGHLLSSAQAGFSIPTGSFAGVLQSVEADYGGYLYLELKNQKWFQVQEGITLNLSSTPFNATFTLDGTGYSFPQNVSVYAGVHEFVAELSRMNPLGLPNETHTDYMFDSWTVNGSACYSTNRVLDLSISAPISIVAVYAQVPRPIEPNYNFGIGLIGLIMMFLSWFVAYWEYKDEQYAEAIMYWIVLFGIGVGLFTVLLGG